MTPHLQTLEGYELSWAEAKARAEAWYEREHDLDNALDWRARSLCIPCELGDHAFHHAFIGGGIRGGAAGPCYCPVCEHRA